MKNARLLFEMFATVTLLLVGMLLQFVDGSGLALMTVAGGLGVVTLATRVHRQNQSEIAATDNLNTAR